jgi:type I restriction enzyme S subunit
MLREFVNIVVTKATTADVLKSLPIGNEVAILTGGKTIQYGLALLDKAFLNNGEVLAIPLGGIFNVKYHKGNYYNANNYVLQAIDNLNARYLYYGLLTNSVQISEHYKGWGCKKLKLNDLLSVKIFKNGLPSLSNQAEIVEILDTLTTHTAELTAELTARKKQYNHYREKLLTFGDGVEWKKLGEVCEVKRGQSITKETVVNGDVPVIAGGRTPAYYHNVSNRTGQTIVIAGSGAYAGFVSWWEVPIFVSDAFAVKTNEELLPRYCYYFLMNIQEQLHNLKKGSGVPHVYPSDVSPIPIPLPPLAVQQEIVETLDKFDALTTSITQGLPKEIELRQKQYEYYRNQLLNFEK